MVVWLEYLVSRGHESSHTCNHGEVCRHFFTLWDLTFLWNLKERTREKFLRCSRWCLPVTLRNNNFPVSWWWKKVRWKFSMHIFSACVFWNPCCGLAVYLVLYATDTHTHTRSLNEISRPSDLSSWKIHIVQLQQAWSGRCVCCSSCVRISWS